MRRRDARRRRKDFPKSKLLDMPRYGCGQLHRRCVDGVEAQNVENYVAGTGRTFRIPAPGHRRPHDIIAGDDAMTGGPRPVPGLSNGHGYDDIVMNCVIAMMSCEYQTMNESIFYYYYIF